MLVQITALTWGSPIHLTLTAEKTLCGRSCWGWDIRFIGERQYCARCQQAGAIQIVT